MMPVEEVYGFVAVYRGTDADLFLLVHQDSGWSFPKGHIEAGEIPLEVARRELAEETGVADIEVVDGYVFTEEYVFLRRGVETEKHNTYFLGLLASAPELRPQEGEISECRLIPYDEAKDLLPSDSRKRILDEARAALMKIHRA